MDSLLHHSIKTPLQDDILHLALLQTTIQKAHLTFIALVPNTYDKDIFQSYDQFNQYFLEKFYCAIHGKDERDFQITKYYQTVFLQQNTLIYTKQFILNQKLLRMVYIPAENNILLDEENNHQSYIKMVKKFFLLNVFMKPSATDKIKLIAMDFIPKPSSGLKGKLKGINIAQHLKRLFEDLKLNFNLEYQPELSKLAFVFTVQEVREPLIFTGEDDKHQFLNTQILVLTNDDKKHPVYRLEKHEECLKLNHTETILAETKNYVEVKNYNLLFHYNRFINYKPKLSKDYILDKLTAQQLWGVIQSIIYPLLRVKQLISDHYQLPQQEGKTKAIFSFIENQRWNSPKLIKNDFFKFNQLFGEKQWNNLNMRNVLVINDDEQQDQIISNKKDQDVKKNNYINRQSKKNFQKNQILSLEQQKLLEYTEKFTLYSRFINQQPNFIHSMILDQINYLSKDISTTAGEIHKATETIRLQQSQRKLLQFTKIIVRFLAQLKKHSMFSSLLEQFNPEFNQNLLEIYSSAYAEFCAANKQIYGKLFDLSQKINDLKSTSKQILKVVKSVNSFTQLYKVHTYVATIDDLQDKRKLLQILLRLLKENKSQQKDKQIDTKIMSTQYDLGATYLKIGLISQYGQTQSKQLKIALKILFNDLYMKLFILRKDFNQEYASLVNFSQLELLQKVSGLLKLLDSIDMAIEVEKKLDNIITVENYYNRWLMKYHRLHGTEDQKKIIQICQKAIEYFTIKFQVSKVIHFYDLLIKNSLSFEEKTNWRTKRFRYLNSSRDPEWCKKGMQKAEKAVFPISEDTTKVIHKLYIDQLQKQN